MSFKPTQFAVIKSLQRRTVLAGAASLLASYATPFGAQAASIILSAEQARAPRVIGSDDAGITIAEYFSMTCSHCAKFHEQTYPRVVAELVDTGRIRFELRPFPLDGLALRAHALCRALPEKSYFRMVSTLLDQQKNWIGADDPIAALKNYARLAGISASDFDLIMSDRPFLEALVDIRQQAIRNFNISSTPSFVVNDDTSFSGSLDYDSFLAEVNKAGL